MEWACQDAQKEKVTDMGIEWDRDRAMQRIYEMDISLHTLEKLAGVKYSTIYGVFYNNKSVMMETANPIAEGLGLPVRELWADTTKRLYQKEFQVDLIAMEFRRVELGMNRGKLAKKCGWAGSKLSTIVSRGECCMEDAVTLAGALEMDVEGLRLG